MQVAVLHQNLEDLAGFAFEKAIVRQDHGSAAAGFQRAEDVLNEVELFVAGLDGEVVAFGHLVGALGAEGRIRQDDVETVAAVGFVDGVAEINVRLDAVQEQVH